MQHDRKQRKERQPKMKQWKGKINKDKSVIQQNHSLTPCWIWQCIIIMQLFPAQAMEKGKGKYLWTCIFKISIVTYSDDLYSAAETNFF